MQDAKKKIIFNAIAKTVKRLRGSKSQFMLGAEFDIPSSVLSDLERAVKSAGDGGVFVTALSPRGRVEYFAFSLVN